MLQGLLDVNLMIQVFNKISNIFHSKSSKRTQNQLFKLITGKEQKFFTPEEILAMILEKMREIAVSTFFIFVSLSLTNISFE
jgi:molecular chaperone DnaK (HSP70)